MNYARLDLSCNLTFTPGIFVHNWLWFDSSINTWKMRVFVKNSKTSSIYIEPLSRLEFFAFVSSLFARSRSCCWVIIATPAGEVPATSVRLVG
jgi:hypothetical protein